MSVSSLSSVNGYQGLSSGATPSASQIEQFLSQIAQLLQQLQSQSGSASSDSTDAISGLQSALSQLQTQASNGTWSQSDVQTFLQQLQQVLQQSGVSSSSSSSYAVQDGFQSGQGAPPWAGNGGPRAVMGAAASALGVDPSTLRSDLRQGMNLQDIAQQQGVSIDSVKSAIVSQLQQQNPQLSSTQASAMADHIIQGPPSGAQQGDPALVSQLQRIISG